MGEITGRQVLGFTVGAFAVIIGVNVLMAYKAISTFPGLEVDNSYVASQTFDTDRKAQESLGWLLVPEYRKGEGLHLTFTDAGGQPVPVQGLTVLIGRTTTSAEDQTPSFVREAGVYKAPIELAPGKWMLHVEAHAEDGTLFRQRLDLFVRG